MKRLKQLDRMYIDDVVAYDIELSDKLISELYVDVGHPDLNCRAQDYIISAIMDEIEEWPRERLPDQARERLRDGLLEYAAVGGGRCGPTEQANLGEMLDRMVPGDAAARRVAEDLLDDALLWTESLDIEINRCLVYPDCAAHWGNSFWRRAYETRAGKPVAGSAPGRYHDVVKMLGDVAAGDDKNKLEFKDQVRTATESALADFDDRQIRDDLINRLIIAYDCLLLRRPDVAEPVSEYIDQQLVRLASDPPILRTDRHWELWSDCVRTLKDRRASSDMLALIESKQDDKFLTDAQRKAFDRVAGLLPGVCPF